MKSQKAILNKIADSKYFHQHWENLQGTMTNILSNAHNTNCTMNDWCDTINDAKKKLDDINALGWNVKHGATNV